MTPKLGDSAASYGRALRQNALHTCLSAHPMCHCCKTRAGLAAGPLNVVCNVNRRQGLSLAVWDVVALMLALSVVLSSFQVSSVFFLFSFFFSFHYPVVFCPPARLGSSQPTNSFNLLLRPLVDQARSRPLSAMHVSKR